MVLERDRCPVWDDLPRPALEAWARVCVWGARGAVIRDSDPTAALAQRLGRPPGTDLLIFPFGGITNPPSPREN